MASPFYDENMIKKAIGILVIMSILSTGCYSRKVVYIEKYTTNEIVAETESETETETETETENSWEQETDHKKPREIKTELLKNSMLSNVKINEIKHTIKGFCCIDIDHDSENEIVFVDESNTILSMLDYRDEDVFYDEISTSTSGMMLNQKGYLQQIESVDNEVSYARIIDALDSQDELLFNAETCTYSGEPISKEKCEELINSFVADSVEVYEFTKDNISLYVDIKKKDFSKNTYVIKKYEADEIDDEELSLMQKVLLGREKVYDTADGTMKKITELPKYHIGDTFYYCDLDMDGVKEVVLNFDELSVLHEMDGVVYRYSKKNNEIAPLYEDGTMNENLGWLHRQRIRYKEFNKTGIKEEVIYAWVSTVCYKEYLNNYENIVMTDEEYAKIKENYKEIPATQYNLNDNNVINIVE